MTLITAFPYKEGMVLSADSQETITDQKGDSFKYSVLKMSPEKIGDFQILVAGGGNGDAIDSFVEILKQVLPKKRNIKTLTELRDEIQRQLTKSRRGLKAVGDDSTMHLFIAAHLDNQYQIWKTKSCVLATVTKPDMIGFTDHLYRHMVEQYAPCDLPVNQLIVLSLRILETARQTSTYVDLPYSIIIVRDNGIHRMDDDLVRQFVDISTSFSQQVNRLLLACTDISMLKEDFEKVSGEFSATVTQLRHEYLQELGKRTFLRMFEPGYSGDAISAIPLGAIMTFAADGSYEIREETPVEIERRRQVIEMTRNAVNTVEAARRLNDLVRDKQFTGIVDVPISGRGGRPV